MLAQMQEIAGQFQIMQKLMQDETFKTFIAHPKVQELFKDEEFKEVAKSRDFNKILAYPKFATLMRDPEIAPLMAKIAANGLNRKP